MTKHETAFRAAFPKARIEKQRRIGGGTYYLVRKTFDSTMYSGSGDTKAAAWKDAAKNLPKQESTTNEKDRSSNDH